MKGLIHSCTVRHVLGNKQNLSFTASMGTAVAGQTVTGATSHATAVIDTVASPLVVKTVVGTFTPGESISTLTWSATLGTQTDHRDQFSQVVEDTVDTTSICRFGRSKNSVKIAGQALYIESAIVVMLPPTVTVVSQDKIISTVPGYIGTFTVDSVNPAYGTAVLHHYSCELAMGGA